MKATLTILIGCVAAALFLIGGYAVVIADRWVTVVTGTGE